MMCSHVCQKILSTHFIPQRARSRSHITSVMFSNYRGYYNKESELQRCMTDHRIKNNPLSSFENKQRSFSNISYMVFFTYFTIYGVIISSYPLINWFCQDSWHIGVDRDWRECKDRQLWVEIAPEIGHHLECTVTWVQMSTTSFILTANRNYSAILATLHITSYALGV